MKILLVADLRQDSGGPRSVILSLTSLFKDSNKVKFYLQDTRLPLNMNLNLSNFDLIHFHEIWNINIIKIIKLAEKNGIPYFFTYHGVLNSWSLKRNRLIKIIFLFLFKKRLFLKSSGFHFLNENEYKEASLLGINFKNKSFILPNGIEIIDDVKVNNIYKNNSNLRLVYIGRLHPKKGLMSLIDTFKIIKKNDDQINLEVIGPNSKYKEEFKREINKNSLQSHIFLKDPVYDINEKKKIIIESDFFLLPSYDEADSMAIKESLSNGTPIMITKECKFYDVEKNNIGFFINHNPKDIYNKFLNVLKINNIKEEYRENCIKFSKENFEITDLGNRYLQNATEIVSGVKYSDNWL